MKEVIIEAKDQKLGRIATEAAMVLRGKDQTDFAPNRIGPVKVKVVNASQLDLNSKKMKDKIYKRYSGYPGGLKELSLEELTNKKGVSEAVRLAVWGMLPKNKLRSQMIKNLIIVE